MKQRADRSRAMIRFALAISFMLNFGNVVIAGESVASPAPGAAEAAASSKDDSFGWLEEVNGDRAMSWVKAENEKTLDVLEKDSRYSELFKKALAISENHERIPYPAQRRGQIYNFWQDEVHVRGLWRSTSAGDYRNPEPKWKTVLDLDALAKAESANWVWVGADCIEPDAQRCLVSLSDGGEDAVTVREFDLGTDEFVKGGFEFPTSKQDAAWIDRDHVLLSRDWGPGTLTAAGYPFIVKMVARGAALSAAPEVFRGERTDTGVNPMTLYDGSGHHVTLIRRYVNFFETEFIWVTGGGLLKLNLPMKSDVVAMLANRLLVKLNEPWTVAGRHFRQGALVSLEMGAVARDSEHLVPTLVYQPGPREALEDVSATHSALIVTLLHEVKGRALIFVPASGGRWQQRALKLPDNSAIDITSTSFESDQAFVTVTGFLTPTTLWQLNAVSGAAAEVKALPPMFDASNSVVEQFEAVSKDGTSIPYFIVHPKAMKEDGSNPTILTAYGGFQISQTPYYSGTLGKLWLEPGGTLVVANIRGGGEFGPAWHEAGLKTHRQRIYDDFAAVAADLIARRITSPRHLGIQGGSNGGLLMGVEFNQHPELWNAVDIQVPLLDMMRYEQLAAGPSWVAEYGSVSVPEERAFLAGISPFQNIRAGVKYPQPLIWTTTKDDRVGPQQARTFAAKLGSMGIPYLYYEVIEGGHAAGANIREATRTETLETVYFMQKLTN